MPPPSPPPTNLYKILPSPPPSPLPKTLLLSALDAKDGFIHLSTAEQTPATAERFFADHAAVWLLKIPLEGIETGVVKWEEAGAGAGAGAGCFAHLYGVEGIGGAMVGGVREFKRGEGEEWGEVLGGEGWLV